MVEVLGCRFYPEWRCFPIMSAYLVELFAYLDSLDARAPLDELTMALARCDVTRDDLTDHIHFSSRRYQRIPFRSGDWYALWVMCWRNGQRSPIHDHIGSSCAVRVIEGTLTETLFDFAPNGHVKPTYSRDLTPGTVFGGEDTDVHQVSNLQAHNADLVTLHIYSPPLQAMGTYSLDSAERGIEMMLMSAFIDAAGI